MKHFTYCAIFNNLKTKLNIIFVESLLATVPANLLKPERKAMEKKRPSKQQKSSAFYIHVLVIRHGRPCIHHPSLQNTFPRCWIIISILIYYHALAKSDAHEDRKSFDLNSLTQKKFQKNLISSRSEYLGPKNERTKVKLTNF